MKEVTFLRPKYSYDFISCVFSLTFINQLPLCLPVSGVLCLLLRMKNDQIIRSSHFLIRSLSGAVINFRFLVSTDFNCFSLCIRSLLLCLTAGIGSRRFLYIIPPINSFAILFTLPCCVINPDSRLHVIHKHIETNALTLIFHGICFHLYACC